MLRMEEIEFEKKKSTIIQAMQTATRSSYYNELFKSTQIDIDNLQTYEEFARIPILTKDTYREHSFDFIIDEIRDRMDIDYIKTLKRAEKKQELKKFDINMISTSGSTGKPLDVIRHKVDEYSDYFVPNLYRKRHLKNIHNQALLWLWPVPRFQQEQYYGTNQGFHKIDNGYKYFLNEYSPETFEKMFQFIIEKQIEWISGFPSALHLFAHYVLAAHPSEPIETVKYIECNSEYLHDYQSETIHKAFCVHPTSIYASNESLFIGRTCSKGHIHVFDKNVFVELIPNEEGVNEVVVTKLTNQKIPLIRYKIGDYAQWSGETCACSEFKSPVLTLKSFRKNDYIVKENGEKIEPLNIIEVMLNLKYSRGLAIQQYQYIQHAFHDFEVQLSSSESMQEADRLVIHSEIVRFLSSLVDNPVTVDIKYTTEALPPDPVSGKFRYFINTVNLRMEV
ncbi:capsular polysaccharide biosynthesis protein CapK [Paenibacillus albidus]|uniref:Capsular polysaccharide biosynthesis protein CapK n=1 Tax=Paenibacillus albidus TaxID=2041023 RepID=A0A917FUR4_9BACL|nr:hypothetical protein [Paenibacillus albidus]GGG07136.1 capsular polysaccharide biosynthesis protein CapK [Paenibacillus albidus]